MIGYRYTILLSKAGDFEPFQGAGEFTIAYEGRLRSDDPLEDLFERFNLTHPEGYKDRSLSIGDLVLLELDGRGYIFACDPTGWRFIDSGVPEAVSVV